MHMAAAALGEAKHRVRDDLLAIIGGGRPSVMSCGARSYRAVLATVTAMTGELDGRSRD